MDILSSNKLNINPEKFSNNLKEFENTIQD